MASVSATPLSESSAGAEPGASPAAEHSESGVALTLPAALQNYGCAAEAVPPAGFTLIAYFSYSNCTFATVPR